MIQSSIALKSIVRRAKLYEGGVVCFSAYPPSSQTQSREVVFIVNASMESNANFGETARRREKESTVVRHRRFFSGAACTPR